MTRGSPGIVRTGTGLAWRALDGGDQVGAARACIRPDGRCFVFFGSCRGDTYEPLTAAVDDAVRRDLHITLDEADGERRRLFEQLGFGVDRREREYLIPTDPKLTGLRGVRVPDGFAFAGADAVAEERLRALDDALRQDVPGTDGWLWDELGFREETFAPPFFDPAAYLVAVDEASGEEAGLVRVWNNPSRPRLGLIAVLPRYRRRGLARALLAHAFAVLHERGRTEVSAEVDETNLASTSLLASLGARRSGGSLELIRRRPSA